MSRIEDYISGPDSARLGFKVARVNDYPEEPWKMVEALRQRGVRLIISRVPAEDVQLINDLEEVGYRLKDVLLTYSFDLEQEFKWPENSNYNFRDYDSRDKQRIVELTARSFQNYGHYANNPGLSFLDTGELYADWARRCCSDQDMAAYIAVVETENDLVGYVAFQLQQDDETIKAVSLVGAVAETHRKQGLLKRLLLMGADWAAKQGACRLEHGVQAVNYPVNRALAAQGCRIIKGEVTLHCWI